MPSTQLSVNKANPPATSFDTSCVAQIPSIIGMYLNHFGERNEPVMQDLIQISQKPLSQSEHAVLTAWRLVF